MITRAVVLALLVALSSVTAQEAPRGGDCPEGRPASGDLGIGGLRCSGGACAIFVREPDGYRHEFSTEPRLADVAADGPSGEHIRDGDVLVAVDRLLVTTPAGGRRLARLEPGVAVELWIRRGSADLQVTITPASGCGFRSLRVSGGAAR